MLVCEARSQDFEIPHTHKCLRGEIGKHNRFKPGTLRVRLPPEIQIIKCLPSSMDRTSGYEPGDVSSNLAEGTIRSFSLVGESSALIMRRSQVRALDGPLNAPFV